MVMISPSRLAEMTLKVFKCSVVMLGVISSTSSINDVGRNVDFAILISSSISSPLLAIAVESLMLTLTVFFDTVISTSENISVNTSSISMNIPPRPLTKTQSRTAMAMQRA